MAANINIEEVLWRQDVLNDIERIKELVKTGIFTHRRNPLRQSALIEIMICLNDLLQKANKKDLRVTFTDDIPISADVQDITDHVANIRNAACHVPSKRRNIDNANNRLAFMVAVGKTKNAFVVGGISLGSDYDDDIAFFYGNDRIYLNRHIYRALKQAEDSLLPLIQ